MQRRYGEWDGQIEAVGSPAKTSPLATEAAGHQPYNLKKGRIQPQRIRSVEKPLRTGEGPPATAGPGSPAKKCLSAAETAYNLSSSHQDGRTQLESG